MNGIAITAYGCTESALTYETHAKLPPSTNSPSNLLLNPLMSNPESAHNLSQLCENVSAGSAGSAKLVFYEADDDETLQVTGVSYAEIYADAKRKAFQLLEIPGITSDSVLLLHFNSQRETIVWFWAATLAGFLPALSTPLVHDQAQRRKHLLHLQKLLGNPVILTTSKLTSEFLGLESLQLFPVDSFDGRSAQGEDGVLFGRHRAKDSIAVLMLTSGSTGNAKAVPLRHAQLMAAVRGKSAHHGIEPGDVFLNWVGMDHVASLIEIHLHAVALASDQVHISPAALFRDPLQFIRLLETHKVAYTFAPNFFLAKICDGLNANANFTAELPHLKALISGGESNVVATCDALMKKLRRFGVAGEVIRPGFGMTELCGGCIYSLACPSYDLAKGYEFANLGSCIPGLSMRVCRIDAEQQLVVIPGTVGLLQVAGPMVFDHYFHDRSATLESFTLDGWFKTGDLAMIDEHGNLNMVGRTKDIIILNGVNWSSAALETAIDEEEIPGLASTFTVVFPHRPANSPTEEMAVAFAPTFDAGDDQARWETAKAISKTISLITGRKPVCIIPLSQDMLEKSSLGKISRSKLRAAFERGEYAAMQRQDSEALVRYQQMKQRKAETETEKIIRDILADILQMTPEQTEEINFDSSVFELGIDSFNLIALRAMIQKTLGSAVEIPMALLLTKPTLGTIASSIDTLLSKPVVYDPIVPLQTSGSKTPLFCIHPGSGDILVFIALAAHFPTRPVYAIRTRGYNSGERVFYSIEETADTYAEHIRKVQPQGPYAIAGYSLGSTLAYEVGKRLEAQGQEVRFLASIDYPPHIAHYVQGLNWIDVLLHIAFFLELIDEATMVDITPHLHTLDRTAASSHILAIGDQARIAALALDSDRLTSISDIAENFRVHCETYAPVGKVEKLDIFVADPPTYAAEDRRDWRENKLGRWADFSRQEAEFHDCPGIHAKMLNREHMAEFAKIFKAVMKRREI